MNIFTSLKIIVFFALFSGGPFVWAKGSTSSLEIGSGINAYTGGRIIPSLEVSYLDSDQIFAWAATGVKSKYYYQSSHLLFYFKNWEAGSMWGGDVNAGFGAGAGYSIRSFQDENSTSESTSSDFLLGPAIRLNWSFYSVYVNFSTVYGLRDWEKHLLGLNFQNVESLTLGYRF